MEPGAKRLSKILLDDSYRHRPSEVLRWSLEAILRLFGKKIGDAPPQSAQKIVADIVDLYSQEVAKAQPFTDLWGETYMEVASKGHQSHLGQFFTPQNICAMMSMMSFGPESGIRKENGDLWRTCDPTSGSGVQMLTAAQIILRQYGPEALHNWSFTCCDLDYTCALMSAVQLLASCAVHDLMLGEVVVYHGNSLFPQEKMDVIVFATAPREPVIAADHPHRIKAMQEQAQLSLFPWYEVQNG